MAQIYCSQCGTANTTPGQYCSRCGASLQSQKAATPPAAIAAIAVLSAALVGVLLYFLVLKKDDRQWIVGGRPAQAPSAAPAADAEEELTQSCIKSVKQISIAMLLYSSDNDDMYPALYSESGLMPYLKKPELFACPKTGDHYTFNALIAGISMSSVERPDQLVVFYEGSGQMLATPHEGKSVVSFSDGHVKAVGSGHRLFWRHDQR